MYLLPFVFLCEQHTNSRVFVQIAGFQDEGLKVRARPPICGPQSVKTQRAWLSAHGKDWTVSHKHCVQKVTCSLIKKTDEYK